MPPSLPAEEQGGVRDRLSPLRNCLNALQTAMQAGCWDEVPSLVSRLDATIRSLHESTHGQPDAHLEANEVRRLLNLVDELQATAQKRREQIAPLLNAWRPSRKADDDTPAP